MPYRPAEGSHTSCHVEQNASLQPEGTKLLELVQHDSVSTAAFKFQAHHLFHIFKFDVHEF